MSVDQYNRQLDYEMPGENSSSGIFRYALGVEYRGTNYFGWQRQNNHEAKISRSTPLPLRTIQLKVEEALEKVADEKIITICAGRTDTGVHAREQIVHFDTHAVRPDKAWILGVNTHLPDDISVHWVKRVESDFHARFSATARTYRYFINNQAQRPALSRELMTSIWRPLDHQAMHLAAQYLIGENDFSSFRGNSCQAKTPVRYMHHIQVQRSGSLVMTEVKANAFLHHMVRNMIGVLIKVGYGEKPVTWVKEVLDAKSRSSAGITAPAHGLYLMKVDYPDHFQLPQRAFDLSKSGASFEDVLANNAHL